MRIHPLRRARWFALAAFVLTAALGLVVDRAYERMQRREEHDAARAALWPYANNAASAIEHRVAQLSGLRAFVQSRKDYGVLEREFGAFSEGLLGSGGSLRAVELMRGDRIALIHPLAGNEAAMGLDLRRDPREEVRRDFVRAKSTDSVVVSGPVPLKQGDSGLIIRQRVHTVFSGSRDQVSLILNMRPLLAEVGLASTPHGLGIALFDAHGRLVASTAEPLPAEPERVTVLVSDGNWELRGGPSAGWIAVTSRRLLPFRLAIVFITLLVTALAWQVAGRDARLSQAVDLRTASLRDLVEERSETIQRQREAELALAASEERLRLALAASRSATFEVDVLAERMNWSPEGGAMIGLPPGVSADTVMESIAYLDESDGRRMGAAFVEARSAPGHGAIEVRTNGADGVPRWLGLTWLSQAGDDGVVHRIVGTLSDVTTRKQLEEQFLHAQKMQAMGALAGGIAHDFNNLLTVILGAGQMARAGLDAGVASDAIRTELDEVLAASERASVLTGQLLAFSRRQVVQPRHFDACDLMGGMGTMLRRLVGEHIRVETALPGTKVPLFADQGQITQVVMNLAVNARDAMPDGGVLRISLRVAGPPAGPALPNESLASEWFAVLSVCDNGSGIDPAIADRIFDPFFTTKPVGKGTGLGLSTVYGIVMQLGGTVRMQSAVGKGTIFDVYLPLAATADYAVPAPTAGPVAPDTPGRTVLLAEDEQGLRRVFERVLTGAGYRVIVAADGAAALAASRAHTGPIDLLVSDVVMPVMGGLELASALLAERPGVRVLLMSGYPQGAGQGTAVSLSDVPFLSKPFKPADLLAATRRALAEG